MKLVKLTRIERRVMGRGRRHWNGSRGHHVTLHPRHDALDLIKGLRGLALSLSAVEGRPKAGASGAGVRTTVRVPIGCRPRGLPLIVVDPLRPGGSLVIIDQRRVEPGSQTAPVAHPMLIPIGVGTLHAGIGWPVVEEARWGVCDRGSVPLWGRSRPCSGCTLTSLIAGQGLDGRRLHRRSSWRGFVMGQPPDQPTWTKRRPVFSISCTANLRRLEGCLSSMAV
jgi:hypothetical protein